MRRKDLDYLVIFAMFFSGLYVAVSGLVAGLFGFPQFFLHRYAGYVCVGLILFHLVLNWGRVTGYLRRRLGRRSRTVQPTKPPPERGLLVARRQLLVSALAAAGGYVLGWLMPPQSSARVSLPEGPADIGDLYHRWSKPGYSGALGTLLDWGGRPSQVKTYPDAERIPLPAPHARVEGHQGLSLDEAIERRRSVRDYAAESLPLEALSRLLHAAQGITDGRWGFRAAPSAGALYPIELYAVVHDVTGLELGLYHYAAREHELERMRSGDLRGEVMAAGLWQEFLGTANVCFVLSAIFQRTRWRYRERTYRYVLLEAGHIGQNLYLAATGMGLGACAVGAFLDDRLNDLLALDGKEEAVLYLISVGAV
jgi:SagB-type dehydrogenase family enzyme